ncbi:uncharacterized protein LOC130710149 [Lotus japonicus]|uniref:uncharacterized protein LOC130710149 n=1 Tax=Lotus japonicus TaxID=34305 RepID=UPI00258F42AC|nr:uncharacterized protein LOC130710149 [Lotus japonicus]XP_057415292.1 uncharacterized protein LOC130710149 [Lotus japonicus]XP_057415293.1 uncharacterized protein LOC130710149 [Lotus japonicus]XP_057415294.1 uncharacterized protein LOC130710149 [Lotus japonicus]
MWRVFHRYGRVWEVFIPGKRNKRGVRFGFVRFLDVQNESALEQRLQQIVIGAERVQVNLAKYSKDVETSKGVILRKPTRNYGRHEGGGSKDPMYGRRSHQTYAQVVAGGRKGGNRKGRGAGMQDGNLKHDRKMAGIEIWSGPEIPPGDAWMQRSMVGTVSNLEALPLIQDAFLIEGHTTVQVKYMGDDLVLLSSSEDVNLGEILHETKGWLEEVVTNIRPWSPTIAPVNRVVWVRCTGLPLNMWNPECLGSVVLPVGDIVKVDEGTSSFSVLEFARVQVRTTSLESVSFARKIMINGTPYTIRIIEEGGQNQCACMASVEDGEDVTSGWSLSDDLNNLGGDDSGEEDEGTWPVNPDNQTASQGVGNHSQGASNVLGGINDGVMGVDFPVNLIMEEDKMGSQIMGEACNDADVESEVAAVAPTTNDDGINDNVVNGGGAREEGVEDSNVADGVDEAIVEPDIPIMSPQGGLGHGPIAVENNILNLGQSGVKTHDTSVDILGSCGHVGESGNPSQKQQDGNRKEGQVQVHVSHQLKSKEMACGNPLSLSNSFSLLRRPRNLGSSLASSSSKQVRSGPSIMQRGDSEVEVRSNSTPTGPHSKSKAREHNKAKWLRGREKEAQKIWAMGQELGVTATGDASEVILQLIDMENRDAEMAGAQGGAVSNGGQAGLP